MRTLLLVLLFCGSAQADNLICLGDSQTSVRPPLVASEVFCTKMAVATGRTALNKGVGGNTSTDMLARLYADVLSQPGSCVTVMAGANDAFIDPYATYDYSTYWAQAKPSAVSVTAFQNNLISIVQQIKNSGKQVTLLTSWAFFSTPELIQFLFYVDAVKYIGVFTGTPVLDADAIQRNAWWGSSQWLGTGAPSLWDMEVDYQHPSALGHTAIANLCQKPQNATACACHP